MCWTALVTMNRPTQNANNPLTENDTQQLVYSRQRPCHRHSIQGEKRNEVNVNNNMVLRILFSFFFCYSITEKRAEISTWFRSQEISFPPYTNCWFLIISLSKKMSEAKEKKGKHKSSHRKLALHFLKKVFNLTKTISSTYGLKSTPNPCAFW